MKTCDAHVCDADGAAELAHGEAERRDGDRRAQDRRERGSISTARLHLTGTTAEGVSHKHDLLTLYVKNQLGAARALPVMATIVAASSMIWVPSLHAILWLSAIFVSHGILISLCKTFEQLHHTRIDVDEWGRNFAAAEFFAAVSWAVLIFTFWETPQAVERVYLIAVLMIIASIKMALASNFLPVVHAGTVPITAAIILRCTAEGTPLFMFLAIMAVCAEIYFVQLARKLNDTARQMLDFRAEKDALIAELEQAKAKSDEARRRAESANLAKSKFLATMSHELRTPLNAIMGFSELMKREMLGPHKISAYKTYSGDIHRSGGHLLNLINEILDLSRVEAGRYELHEEPISLSDIASECHSLLRLRAREQQVKIVENFEGRIPNLLADERAVRQIWLNLMSNAIKFTPEGGQVTLSVSRASTGEFVMSVSDDGPGIPEEELPTVLSSFGQGSLSHRKAEPGAGLGLPIVHGLAKLHDGAFELKSTLGQGTEAIVRFPSSRVVLNEIYRVETPAERMQA